MSAVQAPSPTAGRAVSTRPAAKRSARIAAKNSVPSGPGRDRADGRGGVAPVSAGPVSRQMTAGSGQIGVLIVDVRPPGEPVSDNVLHSLQAVRRTAPDLHCELWMAHGGRVPTPLNAYLQAWKHMVTIRYMPVSHTNPHNAAAINLAGVHGTLARRSRCGSRVSTSLSCWMVTAFHARGGLMQCKGLRRTPM